MKKLVIFFAALAVAAGCAVGPKYQRPDTKAQQGYTQAAAQKTDSITNLKWWEVFQDSALREIIRIALAENKDLKTAVSRVDQARAILGMNKANLGPMFDYNARARVTDFGQTGENATVAFPTNSYSALGSVYWEIDIWGRLRHANRAAYAEMMASEEDRKGIYISLIAQVAEMYFNLRGTDERYQLAVKTLESRRQYANILDLRFKQGQVSELDKLQADQVAFAAEAQVYTLERELIVTENILNVLLGRTYTPIRRGLSNNDQALPTEIPVGLPSQLLERRPDIRASEQRLIAQTERVGIAVAVRFPQLSLTGFMGLASPDVSGLANSDAFIGSITGQLSGPIFRFNQNRRRVEAEREVAKQTAYRYEQTVLNAFAEVENSLADVRTYRQEYLAQAQRAAATLRILDLSRSLYDNGYTSFLQVLDAERQHYEAEYQKSITLQFQLMSTVNLYKALGGGW